VGFRVFSKPIFMSNINNISQVSAEIQKSRFV
jgi:hypothetical protein